jgi:hypothetical protein
MEGRKKKVAHAALTLGPSMTNDDDRPATKGDLGDLRTEIRADMNQLRTELIEQMRDMQTEVLRAFHSWARPVEIRLRSLDDVSQRVSILEERVGATERGGPRN